MTVLRPLVLALAAAIAFALPARAELNIQEVTSPGGVTAWLVEDHGIPFVALEIVFKGGTSLDAPGKRGATYLMTGLIEEGAGDLDSKGFAEARDSLAASFSFSASRIMAPMESSTTRENSPDWRQSLTSSATSSAEAGSIRRMPFFVMLTPWACAHAESHVFSTLT